MQRDVWASSSHPHRTRWPCTTHMNRPHHDLRVIDYQELRWSEQSAPLLDHASPDMHQARGKHIRNSIPMGDQRSSTSFGSGWHNLPVRWRLSCIPLLPAVLKPSLTQMARRTGNSGHSLGCTHRSSPALPALSLRSTLRATKG